MSGTWRGVANWLGPCGLASLFFDRTQPRNGTTHNELVLPLQLLIKKNVNIPNLMETISS